MSKRILSLFFLLISVYISAQQVVYVSADANAYGNGSKSNPYSSLQAAFDSKEAKARTQKPLTIYITSGDYYITEPLNIGKTITRPIVIKGMGDSKPNFIGGIPITHWQQYDGNIYRTQILKTKQNGWYFEQFYINGKRAQLCRTPNEGWITVNEYSEDNTQPVVVRGVVVNPSDLSTLKGVEGQQMANLRFQFIHNWDITRWPPTGLDLNIGKIFFTGGNMPPLNPIQKGSRLVVYNYPAALDEPGEWYLDRSDGYLYYMSDGEDMSQATGIAPVTNSLLNIYGYHGDSIKFENISFSYASHIMPAKGGEYPGQSAAELEAALNIDHSDNISFTNCDIEHTGGYAIWLKEQCNNNTIRHCHISDIGGGGIKLGTTAMCKEGQAVTSNNTIDNNIIHGLGREIQSGCGILLLNAHDNYITHNDIADLYYTGISAGWVWGYNEGGKYSPSIRNHINFNHIHHIGWGETSDMGGVYTLGESKGTTIYNNVIHDILSYDYGGWGIYTDEGSSYITIKNNLVYNCKSGGYHHHYGKDNDIENNIFAFGTFYQIQFTHPETQRSFTFKHNIIYQNSGETLSGRWSQGNYDMDWNLYYTSNGKLDFAGLSWSQWRTKHDQNSIQANPMFESPESGNFHFKSESIYRRIGFKPFDYDEAGVYGSESWKSLAEKDNGFLSTTFSKTASKRMLNKELFK